ncbi:MAG: UDP-N-acetylmuramoyl-tripeptide--D-alanyl-D-alanine ligase [Patescibacteria group bacterium]
MMAIIKNILVVILRWEASMVLKRHKPIVIGVTGSVGKTSAKEAIAGMLGDYYPTGKSPKSYNSELGVPLAVLGLENAWKSWHGWLSNLARGFMRIWSRVPYPKYLVLEMGVDRPGDMDRMLGWIHPQVSVVTTIGDLPVHVEFFSGTDEVASEKAKIVRELDDGYAVLNRDDEQVYAMRSRTHANVLTYGFHKDADIRASGYKLVIKKNMPAGISFTLHIHQEKHPIHIDGIVGAQSVYALLAAAAVGTALGFRSLEVAEGLERYKSERGRLNLISGVTDSLILDDTYNSSPIAVDAALEVLASIPAKRRIAVLGDMLELGKFSPDAHRRMGEVARGTADLVVAVGIRSKSIEGADQWFARSQDAGAFLRSIVQEGDVILIKGSQGMRMEYAVKAIMEDQNRSRELLVRQEAFWTTQ